MRKLYAIQYLRALAAISVVMFHAGSQPLARAGATVAPMTAIGAAGVDVFFVVSGLIMWLVTGAEPVRPATFLAQRIIRIVPLYWAVTLGKAALGVVAPGFGEHAHVTLSHLVLSLLFIPHVSPADGQILPVLTPGWTLNYEMFFYLLFAASLWLPAKARLAALSACLVGLVVAGRLLNPTGPMLSAYTNPLLLEFMLGLWIGALATWKVPIPAWAAVVSMAAGLVGFLAAAISGQSAPRVLVWGAPAALLVAGALFVEIRKGAPRARALTALGDSSYSIYLIHGFFVIAVARFVKHRMALSAPQSVAIVLTAACLSILAGLLCFRLVEAPVTTMLRDRLRRWTLPKSAPTP
jgi:exopolysaccharide production protein ExoZ